MPSNNTKARPPREDRKLDSVSQSRSASPHPVDYHENAVVTDISVPFIYETHSIILLGISLIAILYFAFAYETESNESNIWHAIYMMTFMFLAVGCLVFPAGPFIRPHPIVWRLIFGLSFLYMLSLILLLFQTPMEARKALRFIDPSLGVPMESRDYATQCELTWEVIWSVMDRFVFAHFGGWLVKALIVRNRPILYFLSFAWEAIELATKYFIPNFAECWWDSIILDLIICNAGGIEFGMWLCHKLEIRTTEWHPFWNIPGITGKFKRFALQFTPFELSPMRWEPLKSWKLWLHLHFVLIFGSLIDLNAFLLKLFLWIPTEHDINAIRVAFLALLAIPSAHQYYLYIKDPQCKRLGSQCWMLVCIIVIELALCVKVAPELPPIPTLNKQLWVIIGIGYIFFSFVMLRSYHEHEHGE